MAKKMAKKTISVEDQLKALYQLQVIDTKVDKIRIIRGELPLEIEDLEDVVAGLNTRLEKFDLELAEIQENIVAHNNTIALATTAIEKYEEQLKNIKNNSIDLILTDPPYIISEKGKHSGMNKFEKKVKQIEESGENQKTEKEWIQYKKNKSGLVCFQWYLCRFPFINFKY